MRTVPPSLVWFRSGGGNWNGNPSANPATSFGGIDISITRSKRLFVFGKVADGQLTFNFGSSAFSFSVPSGFTAGWPDIGGGFTTFDSAKNFQSATLTGSGTILTCVSVLGVSASVTGWKSGKYYFEYTITDANFDTDFGGGGVIRFDRHSSQLQWATGADNNGVSDPNGGAAIDGGTFPSFTANAAALNHIVIPNIFAAPTTVSVAVELHARNVRQGWNSGF